MNAFQRSAVFAAVFVLLALHAEATVSQPTPTWTTCTFATAITNAATQNSQQINPMSQFCCPTGIKNLAGYADPYSGCCSDISTHSCPGNATQVQCCRPTTPWVDNDPDTRFQATTRDCYNKDYQGCCQTTYLHTYGNGTTRPIATSAVFDSETQQCCALTNSLPIAALVAGQSVDETNAAKLVITPKGTASCIQHLRATGIEFRCSDDSVCPGSAIGRGKCCKRQMAFGEDPTLFAANGWGRCYDPKYEDCCNAWVGGLNASQTTQINNTQIINTQYFQCCKLPVYSTAAGANAGTERYAIPVGEKCPCLVNSDCGGVAGNANYTCCAPTQAQIQGGPLSTRRLVQCPAAGAATNVSETGSITDISYSSRFPGCYGKCIPSGPNSLATSLTAKVCLNSLTPFNNACNNLRVESAAGFSTSYPYLLQSSQWVTPTVDQLIRPEQEFHGAACCQGNPDNEYSVLYWQQESVCCPVMGTAPEVGGGTSYFPRRLTPVVPRSAMLDAYINSPVNWGGCLCNENSHCQTGFTCCQNGLSWILQSIAGQTASVNDQQAAKARQLIFGYANGTALTGICVDPKTTECCDLKKTDPDTFSRSTSPLAFNQVQPYIASTAVCCAEGGVQTSLGMCGCHTDTDCQNGGLAPWAACCTGNTKFGSDVHAVGKCYDTRRQSCCKFHTPTSGSGSYPPVQDGVLGNAAVYDNSSMVCCPWGGPKNTLADCQCRSDMESTDCGTTAKCCAGLVTGQQSGTTYRQSSGYCYDSAKNQSCCQSRTTAFPANTIAKVYDNNKQVCCPVNGIQRDHRLCQCSADTHCPANGQCCTDAQAALAGARIDCSDFDSATVDTISNTVCPGRCIHKEIETCCDNPWSSEWKATTPVQTCVKGYQKCCDGACCNKATQTCKKVTRNRFSTAGDTAVSKISNNGPYTVATGLGNAGNTFNPGYHYGLDETAHACTSTEHSSPSIVFHTWVFPAFLSVASIIVVLLGSRAGLTAEVGSNMHRLVLVGVQVFVAIMSILLLWSPLWKYGFGIIFANSFILHSFVVGGQWTRRFACILMVVTFLWVYEPFGTNSILNFGTITYAGRGSPGQPNGFQIHGLNYAARMLQHPRGDVDSSSDACVLFYQYWRVDTNIHDTRTWNPQGTTRGICRRSWMHTITVLAGIILPFEAVWLFLAAIAFARASQTTKDVKVQPIQA